MWVTHFLSLLSRSIHLGFLAIRASTLQ
uniref:Uncharacterized protein n=1 Tax=Rhizophora mucronata TaxID=61149 RepID=A0A2P2MPW3_RHIMU